MVHSSWVNTFTSFCTKVKMLLKRYKPVNACTFHSQPSWNMHTKARHSSDVVTLASFTVHLLFTSLTCANVCSYIGSNCLEASLGFHDVSHTHTHTTGVQHEDRNTIGDFVCGRLEQYMYVHVL